MKIEIITIFPKLVDAYFSESIMKRAQESGVVEVNTVDLRDFTSDKHKSVDDTPYGGGGGMVMMIEPVHRAITSLRQDDSIVIATTAKGETLKQSTSKKLTKNVHIIILCGHYEGIDQRILDELVDMQISIGNYVLTGGELAAMVITDSIVRLLPGAVGNEVTPTNDSFFEDDISIQYPIYTKPAEYEIDGKILKVPDVLLSGNHKLIDQWRVGNRK